MRRLDGKRVVVTGAAGGIGSLLVNRLKVAGAHVTGVDRENCPMCDESIITDLSEGEGLSALAGQVRERHVDVLVNLAGTQYFGMAEEQLAPNIALTYAVNLVAPAILAAAVLQQMKDRGEGHIVNIGSVLGSINYPYFVTYSSSKAGLKGYSEALRREVRDFGIAVTYFAPRAVDTAFNNSEVSRFLSLAGMTADDPAFVADRMLAAILARKAMSSIGVGERLFMAINAIVPRVIDMGLADQTRRARSLFSSWQSRNP